LALAALALVVFGAYDSYPTRFTFIPKRVRMALLKTGISFYYEWSTVHDSNLSPITCFLLRSRLLPPKRKQHQKWRPLGLLKLVKVKCLVCLPVAHGVRRGVNHESCFDLSNFCPGDASSKTPGPSREVRPTGGPLPPAGGQLRRSSPGRQFSRPRLRPPAEWTLSSVPLPSSPASSLTNASLPAPLINAMSAFSNVFSC